MNKKMVFGGLLAMVGLFYSGFFIIYAGLNPWSWNEIEGLLGSLLGNRLIIPFVISVLVMLTGIAICWKETYRKE